MSDFSYTSNAHSSYIESLYTQYKDDPASVDITWQKFFEGFEFSKLGNGQVSVSNQEIQVRNLIHAYRTRGHLRSKTNPVRERRDRKALIDLPDFGLSDKDLSTTFQAGEMLGIGPATLQKIVQTLKYIYEGSIGFEYMYIRDPEILSWFQEKVEKESLNFNPATEEKKRILSKLNEAVVFENFLHTKFLGQKRFSLEGGETTIPALDAIVNKAAELGAEEAMIGMAHRGRLNVLANIMGKTYEQLFTEFSSDYSPDQTMGDGDVKYHLGYSSEITSLSGHKINLKLAPNPSHLEAVNPVVEGFVRAKIDNQYGQDNTKILPILIHGDAAIAAQGVVYEVTQMAKLEGYNTGGTIHFVINNQVGFTTDFDDARSSIYCTDVAKIIDAPVLHVNGDDPEAVVFSAKLAVEFRQKFQRDIFIDMVCYRRHGHNESDEPKFTQPSLYNIIAKHANPREVYNKKLIERGDIDADLAKQMDKEFRSLLQDRLNMVKQKPLPYQLQPMEKEWNTLRKSTPKDFLKSPDTSISEKSIQKVAEVLTTLPKNFKPIKQIEKHFKERRQMFFEDKMLNWGSAELLAYGSLLLDGKNVRIAGQDSQRGTFSHRHAVIHDAQSNEAYCNLDYVDPKQDKFHIYNSLLSEYGALGFEFGYAMANPNALVIWEAQFGDFANGAQVMMDQFISCSYTKWHRMNGLVLLLPHGYEGQGPEHSNARPERFLQLASGYNIFVTNITTPANFFHLLRRQLSLPFRMPCVVMSPKRLLRLPEAVSPIQDFTKGGFVEVIDDQATKAKDIKKLLLCSGKIYYELDEARKNNKQSDIAIVRVEQLFPFPTEQIKKIIKKYNKASLHWVQEEPENMGAWSFILSELRDTNINVVSRKSAASPATGYSKIHKQGQEALIQRALEAN